MMFLKLEGDNLCLGVSVGAYLLGKASPFNVLSSWLPSWRCKLQISEIPLIPANFFSFLCLFCLCLIHLSLNILSCFILKSN